MPWQQNNININSGSAINNSGYSNTANIQ